MAGGHDLLMARAIEAYGGKASSKQVLAWLEENGLGWWNEDHKAPPYDHVRGGLRNAETREPALIRLDEERGFHSLTPYGAELLGSRDRTVELREEVPPAVLEAWSRAKLPTSARAVRAVVRAFVEDGGEPTHLTSLYRRVSGAGWWRSNAKDQAKGLLQQLTTYLLHGYEDYGTAPVLTLKVDDVRVAISYTPGGTSSYTLRGKVKAAYEGGEPLGADGWCEADLHPYVAHFAAGHLGNGTPIHVKTVDQSKTPGCVTKGDKEWVHADLYGFAIQDRGYEPDLLRLMGDANEPPFELTLYAFEAKRAVEPGNVNKAFFQAASDSGAAHYGYLAAASVDPRCLRKLATLSRRFGIGVIQLNLADPARSEVLFEATRNEHPDWETLNEVACNPDFVTFLRGAASALAAAKRDECVGDERPAGFDRVPGAEELAAWHREHVLAKEGTENTP